MSDPRLPELVGMGFPEELCRLALSQVPSGSLEDALGVIFMMTDEDFSSTANISSSLATSARVLEPLKMVLVVRSDLQMSPGKVAAQCVHAALGAVRNSDSAQVETWENSGEATICLKCNNIDEMNELWRAAQSAGLSSCVVRDAGRTEVEAGSQTVLAIGPAEISRIDAITGRLKLY
jgi:PTH2 family peptidyl-tRNA hydrolase